jgi:hypothetical protein
MPESPFTLTGCSTQTACHLIDDHLGQRLSFLDRFDKEFMKFDEALPMPNSVSTDYTHLSPTVIFEFDRLYLSSVAKM